MVTKQKTKTAQSGEKKMLEEMWKLTLLLNTKGDTMMDKLNYFSKGSKRKISGQ